MSSSRSSRPLRSRPKRNKRDRTLRRFSITALQRVGIDVTVYEQARRFARVGAGIQISFNAMKVLRTFGLDGADGVHSVVRDTLFSGDTPAFTGRVAYRTVYPATLLKGYRIDDCTKWWRPDRHIVIYYVKPDRSEVYFVTRSVMT